MRIANITYPDVENGIGCRVTLWTQGCPHHCDGCHNPETWSFDGGHEFTDDDKNELFDILSKGFIRGITFSGGDPLVWYKSIVKLMKEIKEKFPTKDIWIWTGYTMKEVETKFPDILEYVDVLIDGVFVIEEKDLSLKWRGSRNQVIWEKDSSGKFIMSPMND